MLSLLFTASKYEEDLGILFLVYNNFQKENLEIQV